MSAPYYADDSVTLHHGDCLDVLRDIPDASVDAVCTDPPYALEFMGKTWDGWSTPAAFQEWCGLWAAECLRVLKPGGHMLAFGGSRTWHRLAAAVEDAGFEIRDSIAWLYGSGFPKSLDVSKAIEKGERGDLVRAKLLHFAGARSIDGKWLEAQGVASAASFADWTTGGHVPSDRNWQIVKDALEVTPAEEAAFEREVLAEGRSRADDGTVYALGHSGRRVGDAVTDAARQWQGWGTALKPAFEPIVVGRKPLAGTVAGNVLAHGTGALNIDGCRVGTNGGTRDPGFDSRAPESVSAYGHGLNGRSIERVDGLGRWPANVVLDDTSVPVVRLLDNLPASLERDIREFFNARTDHLPPVLGEGDGAAVPSEPSTLLLSNVLRGVDGGEHDRREGDPVREGAHPGVPSEDERDEAPDSTARTGVLELEGRSAYGRRLRDGELGDAQQRGARAPGLDDFQRADRGAPSGNGAHGRSATDAGRAGSPRQRGPIGQPPGEPGVARPGDAQQGAPADRRGTQAAPAGEPRPAGSPLEVLLCYVPDEWRDHFHLTERAAPSQAAELDRQSGSLSSGGPSRKQSGHYDRGGGDSWLGTRSADGGIVAYQDQGGASRFFPTFRYEAKAPTSERPRAGDVAHPTVKPLDLMRWLVRLVTPPGGVVLEPFAGSGTTAEACVLEGFQCIAIEREADYLPLIVSRLSKPLQLGLDLGETA